MLPRLESIDSRFAIAAGDKGSSSPWSDDGSTIVVVFDITVVVLSLFFITTGIAR
jgi:hypothetical protein